MTESGRPSNPKIAVIGCGHWGRNLVRNFHELGALACVHDLNADAAKEMAAAYSVPTVGFEETLTDNGVHGVVIATPAKCHAAMAEAALRAGKNVFVEKPLSLKLSEAAAICKLAEEARLVLMVGHLLQYHPGFKKLEEIAKSGTLGDVQYVYSHRLNLGKIRTEENILWSFAPHDISMILGLLGDGVESVSATAHSHLNHDVPDVTTTHLRFADRRAAHVFVSWLHPFKEQRLVVVGAEGMAVFDDMLSWGEKISLYRHRISWNNGIPTPEKAAREFVPLEEAEPLSLECRRFLKCIETGEPPPTDGWEGLRVLRILDAAQRSIETGKTQSL